MARHEPLRIVAFRLLLLISNHVSEERRRGVESDFARLAPCCTPAGIRCLRVAVDGDAPRCREPLFKEMISEMASQIDFSNFDQELSHSCLRHSLQNTNGKGHSFDVAAAQLLAHSTNTKHEQMRLKEYTPIVRGRPSHNRTKRKRF